ncbi:MAG: Bug family tripartite tricarboxylate transporter substrate binding protein [Burkholderiales bacterium]
MKRLLAIALFLPAIVFAQTYPSKPVRLIVPFSPGGATDVIGRLTALRLSEALGQTVNVDNRPGANGNIGTEMAVKAAPDGYTLVMSYDGTLAINPSVYKKMPFDPQKDLVPIGSVGQLPLLMVVNSASPVKNVAEFVAWAKASPGKINYSGAGYGSSGHLAAELLRQRTGIDIVHVNYKGGGQAVTDLLGGQIQMLMTGLTTVEGHVKSSKLRPLAFTSSKRMAGAPDVPTFTEAGYPGLVSYSWYGILGPVGTPPEVVRKVNAEINKLLQLPEVKDRLGSLGVEPLGGTPEQFAQLIRDDTAKWAKVVAQAGIAIE